MSTDNSSAAVAGQSTSKSNLPVAKLDTSFGTIEIQLFTVTMPITAGNFSKLVSKGYYNGVIFHRVITGFMIQGGDPTGTGSGGPGYKIPDEFAASNLNVRGAVAMANAGPNTGGSQFFINLVDNNRLNKAYPVFGKVISGMDVVDKIAAVKTDSNDRPIIEVKIKSAVLVN